MARIRSIKPSFFKSDDVSVLPLRARLTWIGLWTQCDDQGRTKDHARLIKADVWPLDTDVSLADIEDDLSTLADHGRIVRYQVSGQRLLQIVNWHEHQRIDKPTPSRLPPPPTIDSPNGRGTLGEHSGSPPAGKGRERKGEEGKGRARARPAAPSATAPTEPPSPEPPPRCPEHLDDPDPPRCGPCADARRAHASWTQARLKAAAAAQSAAARSHAAAVRAAIDACRQCDERGYTPAGLCTHDPAATTRSHRGAATARAAIRRPSAEETSDAPA